jgi:hypothetical protein
METKLPMDVKALVGDVVHDVKVDNVYDVYEVDNVDEVDEVDGYDMPMSIYSQYFSSIL